MQPAYQRFGAGNRTSLKIDLRLVMQHKLLSLQGVSQAAFEGLQLDSPNVHVPLKELVTVTPIFLGVVHRGIRILDQGLRILTVIRKGADANTHCDIEVVPVNAMWRR